MSLCRVLINLRVDKLFVRQTERSKQGHLVLITIFQVCEIVAGAGTNKHRT